MISITLKMYQPNSCQLRIWELCELKKNAEHNKEENDTGTQGQITIAGVVTITVSKNGTGH